MDNVIEKTHFHCEKDGKLCWTLEIKNMNWMIGDGMNWVEKLDASWHATSLLFRLTCAQLFSCFHYIFFHSLFFSLYIDGGRAVGVQRNVLDLKTLFCFLFVSWINLLSWAEWEIHVHGGQARLNVTRVTKYVYNLIDKNSHHTMGFLFFLSYFRKDVSIRV